jgi:hypothetical protein
MIGTIAMIVHFFYRLNRQTACGITRIDRYKVCGYAAGALKPPSGPGDHIVFHELTRRLL